MSLQPDELELLRRAARTHAISLVLLEVEGYTDSRLNSPLGNAGLDLELSVVYYNKEASFEHVLHEIAHVATAAPGIDYETVPEEFLLMQFERCLCSKMPARLRNKVVDWQLDTVASTIVPEEELGRIEGYETTETWLAGYRRARELDLVDEDLRPTGRRAAWTPSLLREAEHAALVAGFGAP